MNLTPRHYAAIAAFLTGLGTAIGNAPNWQAMLTPLFLASVFFQTAAFIVAFTSNDPLRGADPRDRKFDPQKETTDAPPLPHPLDPPQ